MPVRGPDEVDTCREVVRPAIQTSGWADDQVVEEYPVQADLPGGRIPPKSQAKRRADYVLQLDPGLPLLVIEAKRLWAAPADGIQQAARYAKKIGAPLAMSTNGRGWVLLDLGTGQQRAVAAVPTPVEAWGMFVAARGLDEQAQSFLRQPFNRELTNADGSVKRLRPYQQRAIHETLVAIASGRRRVLVVMATGSGKTFTALQLVWKLWSFRRRQQQDHDLPNYRVLYLADRKVLVNDPLRKFFRPVFGEAAVRVCSRDARLSPDVYFATYHGLSTEARDPDVPVDAADARELLQTYPADFFDLVIVDECHRGSAREESEWRGILDHFTGAVQLGLTATPIERGAVHTYEYFGNPVVTYSLKEGIEDGFLAPYSIRRVVFDVDADGVEVVEGLTTVAGTRVPEGVYTTKDFERRLRLPDRTRAMAEKIMESLGDTRDRAVVFCVDGEHALTMCGALRNLRPERTVQDPEWVSRIMSAEREKDRLLEAFTDPEGTSPQVAVTSSLLSTGVDIEDLRFVVLCRPVGSVAEFKQIIGRGTRLYPEKGKTEFEIIDFVGATARFLDPDFDGPALRPVDVDLVGAPSGDDPGAGTEEQEGETTTPDDDRYVSTDDPTGTVEVHEPEAPYLPGTATTEPGARQPREVFVLDGIQVGVVGEGFWVHDTETGSPRLVRYVDWVRQRVLDEFGEPSALLEAWADEETRADVVGFLDRARIDPRRLGDELRLGQDVDLVDELLHLAWDRPMPTRAERARGARLRHHDELQAFSEDARQVLDVLLDRYAEVGLEEVALPDVIRVPPLSELGSPTDIARRFGGPPGWHTARATVQRWLYSA